MNDSVCIICYETLNHNNIYLLNCCKQSMCNICLHKLNKLICPLCRKTINNDITVSHSYTPSINYINFNFNEISYDDDQILLNFRTRRHNRRRHNRATNIEIKYNNPLRPNNNSINREIIRQGIDEYKNDHNEDHNEDQDKDHIEDQDVEFSFDDIFN
jgi:hypothetical protein